MNILQKNIPNALTCGNLLCGCLGIIYACNDDVKVASILILVASVLDFMDGFVARLLKAYSEIGKQLDSLADMVTFGVTPAIIWWQLSSHTHTTQFLVLPYLSLLLAVFSAIRLAKFNIDTRQSDSFIGVPTPANAMFIAGIPIASSWLQQMVLNPHFLIIYPLLMSYLLVAEIPLLSLKFKTFAWKTNEFRWLLLVLSFLVVFLLQFSALPFIIVLYIILSLTHNLKSK
jgi:CDP-diacylglycerol---serine O-phosphatidyltransferase